MLSPDTSWIPPDLGSPLGYRPPLPPTGLGQLRSEILGNPLFLQSDEEDGPLTTGIFDAQSSSLGFQPSAASEQTPSFSVSGRIK